MEVAWKFTASPPCHGAEHYSHNLVPRSRIPPAILHANRESREEAKRYYHQANFNSSEDEDADSKSVNDTPKNWCNPLADVVLFSENTCMMTMLGFLEAMRMRNVQINRIAVLLSDKVISCQSLGGVVLGDCTPMQALHGILRDVAGTDMVYGVKDLKEVFFIVPTYLMPITPGTIDDNIWFRPACSSGMIVGQVNIKTRFEREVGLVNSGTPLPNCGNLDNWTRTERNNDDEESTANDEETVDNHQLGNDQSGD